MILVFSTFWVLFLIRFCSAEKWQMSLSRNRLEWLIDMTGLGVQGILIPLLQSIFIYIVLDQVFPYWKGSLKVSPMGSFFLNFLVVDYLYYWNHRILHLEKFWKIHELHHTSRFLDVFATSRNTLWTSFFIVYLWINSAVVFILEDPSFYIWGAACTAALDLWRHSSLDFVNARWNQILSGVLITPREHAWHHHTFENTQTNTKLLTGVNFGANFSFWDRIHGTYFSSNTYPKELVSSESKNLLRQFFYPLFQ